MNRLPKFHAEGELAEQLKSLSSLRAYEKLFIGTQIKKYRTKLRMKQSVLAQKLATTQSVVARIEAGKQNLTLDTLIAIAHHLGKRFVMKLS